MVRDTGTGVAAKADGGSGSLGLTMVWALSRQLGRRYSLENDGGAVFRLRAPTEV